MSTTPGSGNDEYTDPHTHSFATESAAAPEAKKASPVIKWVIILFGAFMVIAAILMVWGFMKKGSAPAPAPQAQTAPLDQSAAPTNTDENAAGAPTSLDVPADPTAIDPGTLDPNALDPNAVDPNLAPTVDPNVDPSLLDPATSQDPIYQTIDPNAAIPPGTVLDANGVPVVNPNEIPAPTAPSPVLNANGVPVDEVPPPVPSTPVVDPAAVPAPVVAPEQPAVEVPPPPVVVEDPANSSISQVMDTARQEMMSALDRIEQRLTEMENRFTSLESRVGAIEGRPASATPSSTPAKPAAARKKPAKKKKPAVRKPAAKPTYEHQNRIEILDGSIAPVSRAIIIDRGSSQEVLRNRVQVIDSHQPAQVVRSGCRIQSIKPGRVWVRRADGSFATYGVGDMLPNGRRADSIDPESGVQAGGQLWTCD